MAPLPSSDHPALAPMLLELQAQGYPARTIAAYLSAVRAFVSAHAPLDPERLGPTEALSWLRARRALGRSTDQAAAALGRLFGRTFALPPRVPPPPRRSPSPDQVQRLLQELPAALSEPGPRLAIALLAGTGLRLRELVNLRVADVDPRGQRLRIQRGAVHEDRLLPVPPELQAPLLAMIRGQDPTSPLWRGRYGQPLCARTVQRWLTRASRRAGLGAALTPADLRRAFIAARAAAGLAEQRLRRLAGHGRVEATRRMLGQLSVYA